jgi:feruloyl esterase
MMLYSLLAEVSRGSLSRHAQRMLAVTGLSAGVLLAQGTAAPPEARCTGLTQFRVPGLAVEITKAERVPAGPPPADVVRYTGFTGEVPARCRVDGMINRRKGVDGREYGIGFALALPDNWNHDFLMQGGGGLNGSIGNPLGAQNAGSSPGLLRGFAVASTDTGHKGAGAFDPSFMKDQQASLDFAYDANHRVAGVARQIIGEYYGKPAHYSYFVGCSTGGREGMILSQRYPACFDGIVSGAPAMRTGLSNLADRWAAVSYNQIAPKDANGHPVPGGALSESDRKLVIDALLKACDARDGLRDGMIFDVTGCDFDPTSLTCPGEKTDGCLDARQAAAVKRAFSGPKDSRGIQVYPGFFLDTGINAKQGIPGLLNPGASPVGPRTPPVTQDVDREAIAAENPLVDSVATNLTTFSQRGGKLLFFHGVSDPWFSAKDTLEYYQRMSAANGGAEKVPAWSRIFLVPGMGHCGGGEAALDRFDLLTAIVNWVEKGVAPDSVVATGAAFAGRSRPLCAYPKYAHYKGQGDPEDARNFECRE